MSVLQSFVLAYLLNSLWQVPLIVATAWMAARLVRPLGPGAEHRVWVGALFGECLIPACSLVPWERLHLSWPWRLHTGQAPAGNVLVQMGQGVASGGLHFSAGFIIAVSIGYAAMTAYFAARFLWRWVRLAELQRLSEPVQLDGEAALAWKRWSWLLGAEPVSLVSSREIFAPLTMGIARKCVMLPAEMIERLPQAELDAVIGHELAHVRRLDFVKNLLYEAMSLTVSYHPGVWLTRQRLMESREMVCDGMAAEISGSREYAESLLRLASLLLQGGPVRVPHAIGVFDSNTLERRLMKLTEKKRRIGRPRLVASFGACVALGVATATSAVALRIGVDDQASDSQKKPVHSVAVDPKVMQRQILTKVPPVYPPEAKKAHIQGTVVLDAVIGKTGQVEQLKVASGPKELVQSAMDAVRQWTYKPFLLNGEPIEVKSKITVFYTLSKWPVP